MHSRTSLLHRMAAHETRCSSRPASACRSRNARRRRERWPAHPASERGDRLDVARRGGNIAPPPAGPAGSRPGCGHPGPARHPGSHDPMQSRPWTASANPADTCSTACTTSRTTYRSRTSSRCSTKRANTVPPRGERHAYLSRRPAARAHAGSAPCENAPGPARTDNVDRLDRRGAPDSPEPCSPRPRAARDAPRKPARRSPAR